MTKAPRRRKIKRGGAWNETVGDSLMKLKDIPLLPEDNTLLNKAVAYGAYPVGYAIKHFPDATLRTAVAVGNVATAVGNAVNAAKDAYMVQGGGMYGEVRATRAQQRALRRSFGR